jgi:putative colanic acid biosynthesis acetyltransferase WcaF
MIDQSKPASEEIESCLGVTPPGDPAEPPRKSPWSRKHNALRVLWAVCFATVWKAVPSGAVRVWLLRRFGATIGHGVKIDRDIHIEIPWHLSIGAGTVICRGAILYCLGPVTIGERCLIGPFVHLCAGTHDYTDPSFTLLREPITIGDGCVLMTDSFVAPSVTLAAGTVLRPRCGMFRDTEPHTMYVGNPGKVVESVNP